jgi:hypothetical protein
MAGEFEKLFGPKVSKPIPTWPSGAGVGLIPNNVHPSYTTWPFKPPKVSNILPGKSGLKPANRARPLARPPKA